jgi:hypothetical protein
VRDKLRGHKADAYLFGSRPRGDARRFSDIDAGILPLARLPPGLLAEIRDALQGRQGPLSRSSSSPTNAAPSLPARTTLRRGYDAASSGPGKFKGGGPKLVREFRECGRRPLVLADLCGVDRSLHTCTCGRSTGQRRRNSFQAAVADERSASRAIRYQCEPRQLALHAGHTGSWAPATTQRDPPVEAPLVPMVLHTPSIAMSALVPRSHESQPPDPLTGFWGTYIVWVLFNISLIASSAVLWLRQVPAWYALGARGVMTPDPFGAPTPTTSRALVSAFAFLLLFNEVTKAFVLAAQLQMFNLLVPVVCLAAVRELWEKACSRRLLIWSGACGVLLLAYGSFAILGALLLFIGGKHALKRTSTCGLDPIGWPSVTAAAVFISLPACRSRFGSL